jgi:ABC-type sugar transport system substrate-binding protein
MSVSLVGLASNTAVAGASLSKYQTIIAQGESQANTTKFPGPTVAFTPPKNMTIAIVSCDAALAGCQSPAQSAENAAQALGWKVTMYDGQGSPATQNQVIEEAVASGVNGIITSAVDPSQISAGLSAAHAANIPIGDIAEFATPSPTGYAFDINANWAAQGTAVGAWFVVHEKSKVNALAMSDKEYASTVVFVNSAIKEIKTCHTCSVLPTQYFVAANVGQALGARVANLLEAHPKVNSVIGAYDPAAAYMVPAIQQAGLASKVTLAAIVGDAQNLGYVKNGEVQKADVAFDTNYEGWAAVDQMARLLAKLPLAVTPGQTDLRYKYAESVPWALLVKGNLPPAGKSWASKVNTTADFGKLWGIS